MVCIPRFGVNRLLATAGVLAVLVGSAPVATAEPVGGALIDAPTLPWPDLGVPATLSFYGETSTTTVTFPVPAGLTPVSINAVVDLPFPMRSGVLTVMQDSRLISKVGLPLTDLAPLVIPLPGVRVVDGSVSLSVTLSGIAEDRYCLDDLNPVDLINGSVVFAGREAPPAVVADFLPDVLRKLTIALPAKPTQAESDAAVVVATSLVARYRGQAPDVLVVPLADGASEIDAPALPLERQFVIKEGPEEGLSLQGSDGVPQMLISGPADKLVNQARLLTDSALNVAVGTRAVAAQLHTGIGFPGNLTTLSELGQPSLTATGVPPQVEITLDQTRFGHSTQSYRLRIKGSYTPVPSTVGGALAVSVNGEVLDSWPAEAGGVIDRVVTIPDRLISRYTGVRVSLNTTGNSGRCNEYRPATLTISGSTEVESTPALPPVPAGFGSLPQALMPAMNVGIAGESFPDAARAVQLAAGLQRLSVMPLQTEVMSVDEALASRQPAIIVSAGGWEDKSITLPVSSAGGRITLEGPSPEDELTVLTVDPQAPFGSLQAVFDGQRSLLIATSNGAPAQLDELLRWLSADSNRWRQLRGNALVAFPGRAPAVVAGRAPSSVGGVTIEDPGQTGTEASGLSKLWWLAGAALAVAGAAGAGVALRKRRGDPPTGGAAGE